MHTQRTKAFWLIIGLVVLGLFLAQVEAKALTIGTPDQSFVSYETLTTDSNVIDFTNTQFSYATTVTTEGFPISGGTGSLRESGNLATGELRIYADALAGLPQPIFGGAGILMVGQVGFGDRVFINGNWTGNLAVDVTLHLSGNYDPDPSGQTGFIIGLNTTSGNGISTSNRFDLFGDQIPQVPGLITNTVLVSSYNPYLDFSAFVQAQAADYIPMAGGETFPYPTSLYNQAIFDNTARLAITLPSSEFSFTSESTVLLTQAPTGVPEPSSLLLITVGLVGLAAWRLKRAA